jgi:aminoglycoside/choline kinase family phosphotransferase
MLSWTKDPIPTSLTLLDLPYAKQVVRLFKNVQGFMGDKALSYPNALAQDLLDQGTHAPPTLRPPPPTFLA